MTESERAPDPLGKRALYGLPPAGVEGIPTSSPVDSAAVLPVGKRALYSGARPPRPTASSDRSTSRGLFTVTCERCRQGSQVGLVELVIFQFPFGAWVPRGAFDRRMTCPSCRKRAWCSVTLRRA